MAVALSPWPEAMSEELVSAVERLRAAIGGRAELDSALAVDEETDALGAMASARVEKEAPGAPQAVKDEAVIRFAGYLAQADFGTIASETVGPMTASYPTNHAAAFRYSGAYGLLAPWKVRRAGAIG